MSFLIYGAYGYTGELIARAAVERGLEPILAGRDAARLRPLAAELDLPHRVFSVDVAASVEAALHDVPLVLHCAGPFAHTATPVVDACLRAGVHYLDITGEMDVFAQLAERDGEAQAAEVMLLPGVGFDVVPTDCLAAYLHERMPEANQLELAIYAQNGQVSKGTAKTAIEQIGDGGVVRRGGTLMHVPPAWKTRSVDFGTGPKEVVTIPWGDLITAYHSTGIPNITVYARLPASAHRLVAASKVFGPVLRSSPVKRLLKWAARKGASGPDAEARKRGASAVWAEVTSRNGRSMAARLHGPEVYAFTVGTALAAVDAVLSGTAPPGFQTPATAFGADFVLGIDGVRREDLASAAGTPSSAE